MTGILLISAIAIGQIFKKSKISTIYILIVAVCLAAMRYESADLSNYIYEYIHAGDASVEMRYLGYSFVIKLFFKTGMSFETYMFCFYTICFGILAWTVGKLTLAVNCVLAFYLIYAYGLDVIQMKSLLSECVVMIAVVFLLKSMNQNITKKSNNKFCILIVYGAITLCAVLIHFSSIYYVMAGTIFIITYSKNNYNKKIFVIAAVASAFVYGGGIALLLQLGYASGILGDTAYIQQWGVRKGHLGFIVPVVQIFLMIVASEFMVDKKNQSEQYKLYKDFLMTILCVIPLLMYDITFNRLLRVYMILLYIMYSLMPQRKRMSINEIIGNGCFFFAILYAFITDLGPVYGTTLGALLRYSRFSM